MGFREILKSVEQSNLRKLGDRAFTANRIAKTVRGRARKCAYRVKDAAISQLLIMGQASPTPPFSGLNKMIGVAFRGGGSLHTFASLLDPRARLILLKLLACQNRSE